MGGNSELVKPFLAKPATIREAIRITEEKISQGYPMTSRDEFLPLNVRQDLYGFRHSEHRILKVQQAALRRAG